MKRNNKGGRPPLGKKKRAQHSITFCEHHEAVLDSTRTKKQGDGKPTRSNIVEAAMDALINRQAKRKVKK